MSLAFARTVDATAAVAKQQEIDARMEPTRGTIAAGRQPIVSQRTHHRVKKEAVQPGRLLEFGTWVNCQK